MYCFAENTFDQEGNTSPAVTESVVLHYKEGNTS